MFIKKSLEYFEFLLSGLVLVTFIVLAQIYHTQFQWRSSLIGFTLLIILFIALTSFIRKTLLKTRKGAAHEFFGLRDWLPLLAIIITYENLREFTGVINPNPMDALLYRWDLIIFGVEPTLWIQQFTHPIITDILALFYASYFTLPLILTLHLYWRGQITEFREMALGVGLCLYIGFICYIVFPAGPPRFYFADPVWQQFAPLTGQWGFFEFFHRVSDSHNPVRHYASFPSLHVGLATISFLYTCKFKKILKGRWIWSAVYMVFLVCIATSTIYLRHHWIPDLIAGIILASSSILLAAKIKSYCMQHGSHVRVSEKLVI